MKGIITRRPDGTLHARLVDPVWGYVHELTGVKCDGGYEVEVRLVGVPESLSVMGDEADFEVIEG